MKLKKALIFGASGFIGQHLLNRLRVGGLDVIAYARHFQEKLKGTMYVQGDIRESSKIKKILKLKPKIIYLLAGVSGPAFCEAHPQISWDVNVIAQLEIIKQILSYSPESHLIFSSSRHEYGKPQFLPVSESHLPDPICIYGLHKSYISLYLRFLGKNHGLKATILRTANLYGPHKKKSSGQYNIVNFFADQVKAKQKIVIFGRGNQLRDYVYIDDFVHLLWQVSQKPGSGGIYNVGSGKGTSLVSIAKLICRSYGWGRVVHTSWPNNFLQVETGNYVTDIRKVSTEIGWRPTTDLTQGIAQTLDGQS